MTDILQKLIRSASEECRPAVACADGDHLWQANGGRSCPTGCDMCSQTVYQCSVCGAEDYGDDTEGPGATDCRSVCGDSMTGWKNGHLDNDRDETCVL
jgi:hypothetical protein